ncbi:hypothetical protein V9J68_001922, partial [Vibrio cholerae]
IRQCIKYASIFMRNEIEAVDTEDEEREKFINLMTKNSHFELLLEKINKSEISVTEIDELAINIDDELSDLDENDLDKIEEQVVH